MHCLRHPFPRAALTALVLWLGPALPVLAESGAPVAVAPATHATELAPIARGFDRWLAHTLARAGRPVVPLPHTGTDSLGQAAEAGLEHALVPRLLGRGGRVEVRFTLYAPGTAQVISSRSAEDALAEIATVSAQALAGLAPALGIAPEAISGPLLDELAATTRAVEMTEQGRLFEAFRAVQGKLSPVAMETRGQILERVRRPVDEPSERARVLAASGDPVSAWGLVGSKAMLELRKQRPEVPVLLAAAEIQLARENPRQALRFLEVAVEHAPDSPEVQHALARARLAQGDAAGAREAFERAAELETDGTRSLDALIELDADRPDARATHEVEAGKRLATRLEADRARRLLESAPPSSAPTAAAALGRLESRLGNHTEARAAWARAMETGGESAGALVGMGRAEHGLGNTVAAERSLRRAVAIQPENPDALLALGTVLEGSDRAPEAVPLLRKAHALAPQGASTEVPLARALRKVGEFEDAIALLDEADQRDPAVLRELARSQEASGDLAAADATLRVAARLVPDDAGLLEQRARVLEASGDAEGALADRELASRITGTARTGSAIDETLVQRVDFDAIARSFANGYTLANRSSVAFVHMREPGDPMSWVRRLTRIREPSRATVEKALLEALSTRFGHVGYAGSDLGALGGHVDQLNDFDNRRSLSADAIASVNSVLGSDGVFVSRLISHPLDRQELTCPKGTFAVETRLLLGAAPEYVEILASTDCMDAGLELYTAWNVEAFVVYATLVLFVVFPLVRGWGTIVVAIQLPDKTKGFFSVHVTTKPDQVKRDVVDKKTGREKIRAKRRIDFLRRFSRHMVGRETVLRWIPARGSEYTVTVGGPLLDARGEEVVGFFLEEQRARVRRGGITKLEFDFRPKECAIEVQITEAGQPASDVRVALAGRPDTLRYGKDGTAFLYVGPGEWTVLVGTKDAAAEFRIFVEKLNAAVPLHVDFSECEAVFRDCPEAVEPWVLGDLATAADALEAAGNPAARRVRAELLELMGRSADAALELEAAGDLGQAAELRAGSADHAGSAALYEQAGDLAQAAAAHRAAGAWREAARCYEEIYDYGNALECWREVGDEERELDLLEKLGEYQDAAQIAREMGDNDRAIRNLQQVDQRHPDYRTVCRRIAEIVSERGDHELAVAKFEEALGPDGLQTAALDVLESYAAILEAAGRRDLAISTYEQIRRRDVARTDLSTRIQALRAAAESETGAATQALAGAAPSPAAPVESRYELLDEIGRGGMGVVYKARDKRLGRIVALKRLPDNLRDHPTAVELFEREARAAAALNHQNIVTLFDAGEEGGTYFITMELLEGRALNDILSRHGRISVRDTARIGLQIAAGMHYAHERRIVHRDIKTANLFFTNDQIVKIMDFGIAKSLEEVRRSTTVVGGTPYYMAPEQAKGRAVDHRADLYAFGVTLFQLVTGALPFSEGDVSYLHAHEPPPDPREIQVDVPAELSSLILAMMAKQPGDRPGSAAVISESLRAILTSLG